MCLTDRIASLTEYVKIHQKYVEFIYIKINTLKLNKTKCKVKPATQN